MTDTVEEGGSTPNDYGVGFKPIVESDDYGVGFKPLAESEDYGVGFKPISDAAPDRTQEVDPAHFRTAVMSPAPDLMPPNSLLEPWRHVAQAETGGPMQVGTIDPQRVRDIHAYYDELKDLAGPNQPEKTQLIEQARNAALKQEGVGVVDLLSKPKLPRMAQAESTAGKIGAGLVNAGAGLAEGILQPEVMASALLPGRAVAAFWAADMAMHAPEQVKALAKAWKDGDTQRVVELGASTAVSAWLTKELAKHAATPEGLAKIEKVREEFAKTMERAPIGGETKVEGAAPVEQRLGFVPDEGTSVPATDVKTFELPTDVEAQARAEAVKAEEPAPMRTEEPVAEEPAAGDAADFGFVPDEEMAVAARPLPGEVPADVAAPEEEAQSAPYPPGPPTALPVSLAQATGKTVTVPEVMASLENVVRATGGETPIRAGRFTQRALGIYKPFAEVARLKSIDDIPTAAHEVAHGLQKRIFGSSMAAGLKGVPAPVKTELRGLGVALYGSTKPVGGYISEGFAEFIRHYITTDDAGGLAPHAVKWFEGELAKLPEVRKALSEARALVDIYRGMGSVQRARMQLVKRPGAVARLLQVVKDSFSKKAMVDEFDALYEISKGYEKRSGSKLAPGEDPFLLATWKRGTAGAVVESMVDRGMQDLYGNPTGGLSLRQALAPVKGRAEDFALYLFGRRAVERWGKGKNPGISLEDSLHLVQLYDSPEFQLAAANYYEWNRGVLKYVAEANPAMAPTIDAILKSSKDYAPLARVIDPREASAAAVVARSNPLYRMKGSGRQVRDIFETTLENTSRLVSLAHRSMILDAVVKLSHVEGMGFLVEKVPRDRVKEQVSFEKVREQLEGMGVDTSAVGPDEALTFFSLAETPRGADPIVAVKDVDGVSWYHVSPGVFEALNGLEIYRLPKMLDLFMGAPARAFRLGTTGLRAAFSLVTNPLRDVQTFVMQTVSGANPAQLGAAYVTALRDVVRAGLGGKESGHVEAFHRLGANLAQPLGIDIAHTKRAARTLFHGKFMRVVTNPLDHLRELLSITEAAPRVAELKLIAERAGWTPGTKMTRDQAVEMAVAAKRVTVDFTAGGQIAKVINQAVPFFNASMQGSRSFLRTMRERPGRSVLWGVATLMVPSLLAWWQNKDKEWYRQLPWRERYLYDNIDDGKGNVWQIPRSFEWGNLFQVAPESILDSWYRRDPRGAFEGLKYIFDTTNPADWPVPLKVAKEQWQNRIDFFERPIVPRNQVDLPPGDQRGPYTTKLAQWIGDAFPNTMSPRRIDAAVRGFFGGAVPDLVEALGLGSTGNARDKELADVPVLGRLFRHGGEFSAANQAIADFYDDYTRLQARAQAESQYNSGHMDKLSSPLTPEEFGYWKVLDAEHVYFKLAADIANATPNLAARQKLYQEMGKEAEAVLKTRPK